MCTFGDTDRWVAMEQVQRENAIVQEAVKVEGEDEGEGERE